MIDDRLIEQRQKFHVKIRKQNVQLALGKKRCQFIGQYVKNGQEFDNIPITVCDMIPYFQENNYEAVLKLAITLQSRNLHSSKYIQPVSVLVRIGNEIIKNVNKREQIFQEILKQIKIVFRKISQNKDEQVLPYIELFYQYLSQNYDHFIMYNISCIKYWGDLLQLREKFIKIFLDNTKTINSYYTLDDIEIINGFVQLYLKQYTYLQFIGIINAYISQNNGFQFLELKGSFKALQKIIKYGKDKILYIEIASCNYIMKETANQLERSKSEELITQICYFLKELCQIPETVQIIMARQREMLSILIQILVKKVQNEVKFGVLCIVNQITLNPDISRQNFPIVIQKLIYLYYNYQNDPKIISKLKQIYLTNINYLLNYSAAFYTLNNHQFLFQVCLKDQTIGIIQKVLLSIQSLLSLYPHEQSEQNGDQIILLFINTFKIKQYLINIINSNNQQVCDRARMILEVFIERAEQELQL